MWARSVIVISLGALVSLTSCEFRHDNKPSILVIAVEGLGFDSVNCDTEEGEEGIQVFCGEAVRFSHTYTPSTMSQAGVASLLTGLYPFDHGVHHNGSDFLSAQMQTLGEVALAKGYRTIFVSGGPPIWRKSGLAQGFEVFDDSMDLGLGTYYRPVRDVFRIFMNWLDQQNENSPFVAFTFLSDLQFGSIATVDDEGEVREKSAVGQLEEIDESLSGLIRYLKSRRRWNNTHIVLVGLNSLQKRESDNEPLPLSLRSLSVQVALFIKPARKERDNVMQWAVDRNVSLVDVGATMFRWLGKDPPSTTIAALKPQNLNPVLTQPEPNWKSDRLIVSETAWPDWLEGSGIRWSVRQGQFLFIDDAKPLIFNMLTDRLENIPLRLDDPLWNSLNEDVLKLRSEATTTRWRGMHRHWLEQLAVAKELWVMNTAERKSRGEVAWARWYLGRAVQSGNWKEVRRLSQEMGEPVGAYVASRHLGEHWPLPRNACVRLIVKSKNSETYRSECEDEQLLNLSTWMNGKSEEERNSAQERLIRSIVMHTMSQEIGRMNHLNDLRWDVDREWPRAPSTLELLLTLKELEPYSKKISSLMSGKNFTF